MPLPLILPLFPLPNVVLFPRVLLPLHIFEPRYCRMVKDVAAGDGLIGMILLRDAESCGQGDDPDTYSVGCAGRMIRQVPLPDGRSNILLQGVREFVPRQQSRDRPYRTAEVDWLPPPPTGFELEGVIRDRLVKQIRAFVQRAELNIEIRILEDPAIADETLINLLSFGLDLPVEEKQSLLEICDTAVRAERLIETIEFHLLEKEFVPGAEGKKHRRQ